MICCVGHVVDEGAATYIEVDGPGVEIGVVLRGDPDDGQSVVSGSVLVDGIQVVFHAVTRDDTSRRLGVPESALIQGF